MESWRERGFVPDSDSEDGLDSQESGKLSNGLEEAAADDSGAAIPVLAEEEASLDSRNEGQPEEKGHTPQDTTVDRDRPVTPEKDSDVTIQPAEDEKKEQPPVVPPKDTADDAAGLHEPLSEVPEDEETPRASENTNETRLSTQSPEPANVSAPLTPRPKENDSIWDMPSSEDELQFDHRLPRRPTHVYSRAKRSPLPQRVEEKSDVSTPSSPLSSIDSVRLNEEGEEQQGDQEEGQQDDQEQPTEPTREIMEQLLPPLDIPEEILQELSQPARRSLRERKAIQLHPYMLEDAKYRHLMRARGVKPVRAQQEVPHPAVNESQNQAYVDVAEPMSDSFGADFQFPPSSPVESRRSSEKRPSRGSPERARRGSPQLGESPYNLVSRQPKRRKVSKPQDDHPPRTQYPQPRVVIDNSSPLRSNNLPIFHVPSPPRSEEYIISSPPREPSNEFRFPHGFTPPSIATNVEPDQENNTPHDEDVMDWSGAEVDDGHEDVHMEASQTEPNSEVEDADEVDDNQYDDAAVRRYQRRMKGVLPASWLRLDQKKQEERLSATQHHERVLSRTENAKGVARKITKKNSTATASGSNAQLASLRQLADSDSGDESESKDNNDQVTPRQMLARLGIEETFNDQDIGPDIMEDNRIDYMFPPAPRGPSAPRARKQGKKRPTFEANPARSATAPKRARLKKQARLTDHVYGAQKQKRPRPSLPKLGILDAPDVASRPRTAQPQFLRIAAREARSRQDRGRRSPSRKVFNLSTHLDTEDANMSLREWKSGRLQQTKLPQRRPQAKSSRRQPLTALSTNRPAVFQRMRERRGVSRLPDASPAPQHGEDSGVDDQISNADAHASGEISKTAVNPRATQTKQQSNKWVVRRNLAISSLKRRDLRPAMLEMENPRGKPVSSSSFQRSLSLLNRDYRRKRLPEVQQGNLVLDRFISSRSSTPTAGAQHKGTGQSSKKPDNRPVSDLAQARRQLKKRPPKRLQVNAVQDQGAPVIELTDPAPQSHGGLSTNTSVGALRGFQISYSIEFSIVPLYIGTYFHETTFLGSGEFSRSLDILKRDLDRDAGLLLVRVGDVGFRWGAWNDTVSSELGTVFEQMVEWIEKNDVDSMEPPIESPEKHGGRLYRSLVKYVTDTLSFIDPVDRTGFVRRAHSLVCKICDAVATLVPKTDREMELFAAICSYNTVFTYQVLRIAQHELVDDDLGNLMTESLDRASKQALTVVSSSLGQANIRKFLADIDSSERRDAGIERGQCAVETYVTVRHVLRGTDRSKRFEDLLTEVYSTQDGDLSESTDVVRLEGVWPGIFTTLPLDEFDTSGIARVGSRFGQTHGNWPLIKKLLRPVLDSYDATSASQPVSYYKYCRALFHRCFHLISGWGWRDCKPILDTLYDFFARNTLYNLKQEESFRSPAFLDELDRNPSLEVQPGDPCFHIVLKIIASGLHYLSKTYDKKKVRNFAWRLLPNHGRVYPKEKPIHQTDLDALRNHHDLLCTLYYAVPDGCRPRLEAIKNLVHPASSHRETCNISLRSWDRLVRFKLSTDEDVSGLEAFADWHCYFVTELLKQHAFARQEVEAQNTADNKFSDQLIERTIAQNQRQIESLLKTALNGLQNAVHSAPSLQHAQKLVSGAPVKALLALFNPRVARVNTTVSGTLEVIIAYLHKCNSTPAAEAASAPVVVDEDSQEYGDWADIAAAYDESPETAPEIEHVEKVFHPAVFRLISNCFGEDYCPEDAILLNAVDCWTSIAHTLVKHRLRHWDSYLSPYNGDSWTSLRLTIQTRKFTPLFLASCIEKDVCFTTECKVQTVGMWMSSLVERVSMLKFQHRLTEALLNQEVTEPLLQNLPFARERKEARYTITLEDLSQRRVSLISCVLANMRAHLQLLEDTEARELSSTKQEYREIIQNMMSAMKANYQELGHGAASVQGAYVDFVHRIVGFLQQHSRDICPIDPFFTDPASFPLPSGDPTYIVARLKSYEPKLASEKVAKTLIMFIQSVSERAAIDGQHDYLVHQLHASITDTYESGLPNKPTLRATLLQAVFPAYLEASLSSPACWILSRPIIQTISLVFKDLLFNIDSTDPACVGSVLNTFYSVFQAAYTALSATTTTTLNDPTVATTVASLLKMITSTLPIIDYIDRSTDMDQRILSQIQTFHLFILAHLSTTDPDDDLPSAEPFTAQTISSLPTAPPFFPDLRHSATRELRSYLAESWSRHQRKYYFTRRGGHQPQEIDIQPSVAAELEQPPDQVLKNAATEFLVVARGLNLIPAAADDDDDNVHIQHPSEYGYGGNEFEEVSYTLDLCY
ncbi:hypothetical protein BO71DRAFT_342196 [Aspergillus ellipticus CBS 707.79]|uniref:Mus7/MMS22 family-domain-containing protein n=1 Tax=Aspergillus ellipticus CBS 707.79 TaxID=1448320 RepID=A0A319DTC2_9EURO|nr:hypothetical protein BO71DRAFT_342196 [Aspergillus ellipticus CBS 707.79]